MSASILVAYATKYGSTQEVGEAIAAALREGALAVDCRPLKDVQTLEGYTAVVLGAPLYMFRWHKGAKQFLSRHRQALMERPVAVFAMGPLKDEAKDWQDVVHPQHRMGSQSRVSSCPSPIGCWSIPTHCPQGQEGRAGSCHQDSGPLVSCPLRPN